MGLFTLYTVFFAAAYMILEVELDVEVPILHENKVEEIIMFPVFN